MRAIALLTLLLPICGLADDHDSSAGRTRTGEVGDALEFAMPLAVLTSTLWQKDWQGSKQWSYGMMAALAGSHGLKSVISKERPDGRDDRSFPSAHTAVAMHSAAFVHKRYGIKYAWPAYLLAAYVGHSRVHDDRHDEQDVIAGAALGYMAAHFLTTEYRQVQIAPVLAPDMIGISLSFRH